MDGLYTLFGLVVSHELRLHVMIMGLVYLIKLLIFDKDLKSQLQMKSFALLQANMSMIYL